MAWRGGQWTSGQCINMVRETHTNWTAHRQHYVAKCVWLGSNNPEQWVDRFSHQAMRKDGSRRGEDHWTMGEVTGSLRWSVYFGNKLQKRGEYFGICWRLVNLDIRGWFGRAFKLAPPTRNRRVILVTMQDTTMFLFRNYGNISLYSC